MLLDGKYTVTILYQGVIQLLQRNIIKNPQDFRITIPASFLSEVLQKASNPPDTLM